ncbi:MAG: hypothetical protein R3Y05_03370 [bacterium]
MKKNKDVSEEFIKKANKLITLTSDEQVVEILVLMKEEFDLLEDEDSEFVNAIDGNISAALDKLVKEVKKDDNNEKISAILRDIKVNLVKRYNLVTTN